VPELEIKKHPPSMLKNIDDRPLAGADGDPGASTINIKKRQRQTPWEVSELEIRKRPPSTLRNVNDAPLRGAGAGDPGVSTINVKNVDDRHPSPYRGVL
jgi:hypothetical protein